ncbi:hypothetical protein [Marinitenerispora sediminis]|uniref:DUF3558 domain-containing protein n=1 Tax=Marinitenerispora sediminis TaxID=1931232 RepID=A0A368SYW6_9ACTN|nr:hypothetical protein [Marinitenerispora sediminis]RCV50053.1 hypothetical protein DEF24_24650 [Marinitenerispora sediminis]RCV50074.1 hypothetical protein DEF23_22665 [Marinitenerispora sediminis]RCV53583.1 hypothetical protein DEF28_10160 [Marinitenerispora sediminis]
MTERTATRDDRRGLRGWRAALVVVGSGTLAGLLVMALVVGVLRMLQSGASSTPSSTGQAVETRQPRETTAPGVLDLCELVQTQSLMSASPYNRTDDATRYEDTAEEEPELAPRTVTDECSWEVASSGGGNWRLTLSYRAFMSDSPDESRADLAAGEYSARSDSARAEFASIENEGPLDSSVGESHYVYGESRSGADAYAYVGLVKSGVFMIHVSGPEEIDNPPDIPEQEFRAEVRTVVPYLERAFERQIPD